MEFHGHIQNGSVTLDGNPILPEGAAVTVSIPSLAVASLLPPTEIVCEPGRLPYVRGGIPGGWQVTRELLA